VAETNSSSEPPRFVVSQRRPVVRSVYTIEITRPPKLRRHDISDDELEILRITAVDGFLEAFWGCLGALFAALPSAIDSAWDAWFSKSPHPLTVVHMIEIAIVIAAFSAAITLRLVTRRNQQRTNDLVKGIRKREVVDTTD
jgi:hypothetical protein